MKKHPLISHAPLSAVPAQPAKQSFSPRLLLMAHRCVRKSASPMRTGTKPPPTTPSAVPSLAPGAERSSGERPEQDTHPGPAALPTPAAPTTTSKGACPSFLLFLLNLTEAELDCCFTPLSSPHRVCPYQSLFCSLRNTPSLCRSTTAER